MDRRSTRTETEPIREQWLALHHALRRYCEASPWERLANEDVLVVYVHLSRLSPAPPAVHLRRLRAHSLPDVSLRVRQSASHLGNANSGRSQVVKVVRCCGATQHSTATASAPSAGARPEKPGVMERITPPGVSVLRRGVR